MPNKFEQIADIVLSMNLDELDTLSSYFYDYYHNDDSSLDADNQDSWVRMIWEIAKLMKTNADLDKAP